MNPAEIERDEFFRFARFHKSDIIWDFGCGTGRYKYPVKYVYATDMEAVEAFEYLSRTEGIIPAIESAHAVAYAKKLALTMDKNQIIVINLSGRGDKDVASIARLRGVNLYE